MKNEKSNNLNRMSQNSYSSSHSMQSNNMGNILNQGPNSSMPSARYGSSSTYSRSSGPGRGWHGDPKGHARAGAQSHKRTGNRHS